MTERVHSPYLHTVDVIAMRYISNRSPQGKDLDVSRIEVLLNYRAKEPFANTWALPGIVVNGDQRDASITDAAKRLMRSEKVGIEPLYIEQVGTEGNAERDPRCWSSTTFYLAFVPAQSQCDSNQKFVPLADLLSGAFKLPFDHNELVASAFDRLYSKSLYSSLPLLLLGDGLTLTGACEVTSCIVGKDVQKSSMRVRLEAMIAAGYLQNSDEKVSMPMGRRQALINNIRPGEVFFFDRCIER